MLKIKLFNLIIIGPAFLFFLFGGVFSFAAATDTTQLNLQMAPFPPPGNLKAAVVGADKVKLSWSAVSIAVHYKVYRDGVLIASLANTFYEDKKLNPGFTYFYGVSAVNAEGAESQSSYVSATIPLKKGGGGVYNLPYFTPFPSVFPPANPPSFTPPPNLPPPNFPPSTPSPAPKLSPQAEKIDINKDGKIDISEFNLLMVNWGVVSPGNPADFSGDGIIDIFDFNLLMVYWIL